MDVKHLPKLRTAGGEWRKRFLFVAIDRRSRSVHLAVRDEETEAGATAFLREALAAFPFRVTRVLTDRGSCFTAEGFEKACRELGVEHRKTRPYTPRTNGMVERFNGRVQREVLGITVASHRDLERLLAGFSSAYNARRQRVLGGRSPEEVVRERLRRDTGLANPAYRPPPTRASCPGPCWSSSSPMTSRSQTPSTTLPPSARLSVSFARLLAAEGRDGRVTDRGLGE
jgi:transposase InsO family protein